MHRTGCDAPVFSSHVSSQCHADPICCIVPVDVERIFILRKTTENKVNVCNDFCVFLCHGSWMLWCGGCRLWSPRVPANYAESWFVDMVDVGANLRKCRMQGVKGKWYVLPKLGRTRSHTACLETCIQSSHKRLSNRSWMVQPDWWPQPWILCSRPNLHASTWLLCLALKNRSCGMKCLALGQR